MPAESIGLGESIEAVVVKAVSAISDVNSELINIGENIKKHRNKQGLSQEDFAKKSGVKYTTLTKIESNVIKKPSVILMSKLAKTLGVSIEDLIK